MSKALKTKIGLILESGAMRGLFTAGVLDVFMERRLKFDGLIGVSAGARILFQRNRTASDGE